VTETDEAWCGQAAPALPYDLRRITVPLFLIGAAGGSGDTAIYSTTVIGSRDVSTLVIRRFGPERVEEDFGHGDLLFAAEAPALVWSPLAAWLTRRPEPRGRRHGRGEEGQVPQDPCPTLKDRLSFLSPGTMLE